MKIAILEFPGSNCETETLHAVRHAGMEAEEFLWNEDHRKLEKYDGYVIIGGFSYEDRSRSGIIASLDPIMDVIRVESDKGKPVLGICNGAQILVESGLVPGLANHELGMALAINRRIQNNKVLGTGYYNAWVHMKLTVPPDRSAFTKHFTPNTILRVPVAHGEGRFVMEAPLLAELKAQNQTPFQYTTAAGVVSSEFPVNPNGAINNLAAVTNPRGNIMAIMPHPERTQEGTPFFTSMREYIVNPWLRGERPLSYTRAPSETALHTARPNSTSLIVNLLITDNEAKTVKQTLEQMDIHADIKRYTHWEIEPTPDTDPHVMRQHVIDSGELYNNNKESVVPSLVREEHTRYLLVRYYDDVFGQSKLQVLRDGLSMPHLQAIHRGTLWQISVARGNIDAVVEHIMDTHILHNPFAQECLVYQP